VDAVIFVFSLEDEISFQTVYHYYSRMANYRNTAEVPLVLVGTQGETHTHTGTQRHRHTGTHTLARRDTGTHTLARRDTGTLAHTHWHAETHTHSSIHVL
jgi:GTPase SAR1 family protein